VGDVCPKCKKGRMYPTGKVERSSSSEYSKTKGQEELAWDEFQCDICEHIVREITNRDRGEERELTGIRVQTPKSVNGKKMNVTTVKAAIDDNVYATTIRRTTEGESADLQIKFRVNKDGTVEFLHVHCQCDKESSGWGKADGRPIEELYDKSQVDGSTIIGCKACGRRWKAWVA
jgi:hypothetical protein